LGGMDTYFRLRISSLPKQKNRGKFKPSGRLSHVVLCHKA